MKTNKATILANFEKLLIGKTPKENEIILKKLLPSARSLTNQSIYLEMLARLALTQAIQKKFNLAHKTLNKAEEKLTPKMINIKIRLMIERGRLFYLSNNNRSALPILKEAYKLSKKYSYDDLAIDAVHFIPVIVKNIKEKIKWNQKAINIAKRSRNKKMANDWLALLYQSLGLNYLETKKYKNALQSFHQAKKIAVRLNLKIVVLGAEIGIAKSLRLSNQLDKALNMHINFVKTWKKLSKQMTHPVEMKIFHGWICEDLAEIYLSKAQYFSGLAYKDLSQDDWHRKYASKKLTRLNSLQRIHKIPN